MIALLRLGVIGAVVLTVVYIIVSLYSRSVRRGKLERRFDEEGHPTESRDAFITAGLADYEKSLRRKLILLVYIIPVLVVAMLVYLMNFT
ncbi:MAG: hypothetical protein ABJO27_16585 [Pseudoruegeria sp.]